MSDNYGTDPEKMLDWDKKLGEQSEFVKKAIQPLLTWELAYHITISDNNYSGDKEADKLLWIQQYKAEQDVVKKYILKNGEVVDLFNMLSDEADSIFVGDEKPVVEVLKSLGIEGCRHQDRTDIYNDEYLTEHPEQSPLSGRQLETAQKTGYVQGVCESVLAFNNDENRKIMSEAAMTFLSKKILSEMNVTKDMAQKFANPETYKALEQCVFAPKQEQQLEQTQSHKLNW